MDKGSGSQQEPGSSSQQEPGSSSESEIDEEEILRGSAVLEVIKEYHKARKAELERQAAWEKWQWEGQDISAERERRKAALNHQSELFRKLRVIAGGK